MDLLKKLFVGLGCVFGVFWYVTLDLIESSSKGKHKKRHGDRHHSSNFWKMLEHMIIYNWFREGIQKSRTRVKTAYYRRTGQRLWQEQETTQDTKSDTPVRSSHQTETTNAAVSARKPSPAAPAQSRTTRTAGTSKREEITESYHPRAVDPPVPVRTERKPAKKENRKRPSGMDAANIPELEEPNQKTAQEAEAARQMQMKDLRLALLDEVRAIHAAPAETGRNGVNGSPEQQLSLLLYQPDLPQKELKAALDRLRAERIRQKATYQGAPFADVFPVSLILAEDDSERACIVDVGETGMSYVIPWSSIPAELRGILKRYVSEAGGKLLGYCKEELCNDSTNRMIVELYLGKQDRTVSRILF